jgi:hypothetical protein
MVSFTVVGTVMVWKKKLVRAPVRDRQPLSTHLLHCDGRSLIDSLSRGDRGCVAATTIAAITVARALTARRKEISDQIKCL